MKHTQVDSSWIKSVGYEPQGGKMEITNINGKTSVHHNVPMATYQAFMVAPSMGAFFHAHIKKQHPGVTN
jgi:hypothetical protein